MTESLPSWILQHELAEFKKPVRLINKLQHAHLFFLVDVAISILMLYFGLGLRYWVFYVMLALLALVVVSSVVLTIGSMACILFLIKDKASRKAVSFELTYFFVVTGAGIAGFLCLLLLP